MLKRLLLGIVVLIQFTFSENVNFIENRLITKFQPGLNEREISNSLEGMGLVPQKLLVKRLNIWLVSVNPTRFLNTVMALEEVRTMPEVVYAQLDHVVTLRDGLNTPDDPNYPQMWDMNNTGQTGGTPDADIDAPEAWDIATGGTTATGEEIVVAVIDGGVDVNHADLIDNIWVNENEIPGNNIDDDNNGYIDDVNGWNAYNNNGNVPSDYHGTHVSGTVGARGNNNTKVVGINWDVKIMAIAGASSSTSTISIAYGYVLDQKSLYLETGGLKGANVVSTNSSFGIDYADCNSGSYPIWNDLYNAMGEVGILSAAATINANQNVDQIGDVPTGCDSEYMIAVTNTDHNDQKNYGAGYGLTTIDLGAPGTNVLSTVPGGGITTMTGTSMATPHVAGAVGLLHAAASPGLAQLYATDPAQGALIIRDAIFESVDPITSLNGITVTGGRLNIYNAVLAVQETSSTLEIVHIEGWNMVGLPLEVEDSNYLTLFPDAITSTLYTYDINGYTNVTDLAIGTGYWLRFTGSGISSITGMAVDNVTIALIEDWNVISGISSSVDVNNILDPDGVIIAGTIYGYDGIYANTDTIEPGVGYWMRASANGNITIATGAQAKTKQFINRMEYANTISFNGSTLYFGVDVPDDEVLSYSLPPKPPVGAMDARFIGDWKYTVDSGEIELMNNSEILEISYNIRNGETWQLLNPQTDREFELRGTGEINVLGNTDRFILEKQDISPVPGSFSLSQNYPNPFNPVTIISYQIPYFSPVNLSIFNLNGQLLTTLVNEPKNSGSYTIEWDASGFGSGIYFYKLQAGNFSEIKKCVVVK